MLLISCIFYYCFQISQIMSSSVQIDPAEACDEDRSNNIIKQTRRIIRNMSEGERLKKAKAHVIDALKYKHQRHQSESKNMPLIFNVVYFIQLNQLWSWILYLGGYIFLCLAAIDHEYYSIKIGIQATILSLFWFDTIMQAYLKEFDMIKGKNRYNDFFYFKLAIIILMTIDLFIFIALPCYQSRPIRPFRILRCFVFLLFDSQMRKMVYSFLSAYVDIAVYLLFFALIVAAFAVIGNKSFVIDPFFKDPSYPQNIDPYKTNYLELDKMIFIVYVTATYDSYPDNQILALQNYQPNYIFFIVLIIMNFFLFSSIPGQLIYTKYRETRSKLLIADQIRQQHSLIIAFVTLAGNQSNLSIDKLIKFLLFLYKYKIRYIEYITDICLKLDNNNNRSIQVNEFMQLSKIILQNEVMMPPSYDDMQMWIDFRRYVNETFHFKAIVRHWLFQLLISITIILSFINALFLLFSWSNLVQSFENFFVWFFFAEMLLRVIAIGPQNFFLQRVNNVDAVLIGSGIIFFFTGNINPNGIVKILRIFRLASLTKVKEIKWRVWVKVRDLFSIIFQITPIIIRFLNLFIFFYYIFGILGMEIFYNFYATNGSSTYSAYQQFSNYKSLINSQYINIQILYQAGWSTIANNLIFRAPQYYTYIYLYFCFMHIMYVYIIAYVIKGIFWEVYFAVHEVFQTRDSAAAVEEAKEQQNQLKTKEINQIDEAISNNQYIEPNTITKKALIENKFDQEIFQRLYKLFEQEQLKRRSSKQSRQMISSMIINDWAIDMKDIDEEFKMAKLKTKLSKQESRRKDGQLKRQLSINLIEEVALEDFQFQLSQLLDKVIVHPKIKYSEFIASPRIFMDFLTEKLKHPSQYIKENEFNLHQNPLHNQESMYYHIYEMHAFLNLQTSKRQQKSMIINSLIDDNILTQKQGEKLVRQKLQEKKFQIDSSFALRKLFLADVPEEFISKLEIQYFSQLYGYSFKYINKVTLQPLLKFQAEITSTFRNIMRYPQIDNISFFEMLTSIQDRLSNRLLQRGSLFKFLYKLDCQGDIWFSIDYKRHQDVKVRFLKSGLWCFHSQMKENHTLYGKDIFNWTFPDRADRNLCEQYIKRFYQSFQTLATGLIDQSQFFASDPKYYIYDLYLQYFSVERTKRFVKGKFQISKIMVVILSKEEERADMGMRDLPYRLSDISHRNPQADEQQETYSQQEAVFEKLKDMDKMASSKIVESEGLPFAYITNLIKDIEDVLTIYGENFVYQIEKTFNQKYEQVVSEKIQERQGRSEPAQFMI